jgi:hypothetical protein
MPKKRWNKDLIIAELKRCRQNGPKVNITLDAAARKHFGSLRAALEVAGLPCAKKPPPYKEWSRESVIEAIRRRHTDGEPIDSVHHDDPPLYAAGKRLFCSWSAARAAAGYPRLTQEFYSADEVRLRIVELFENELPLTFRSHNDVNLRRSAKKHFGGWGRAVKSLGLGSEVRRMWTDQLVIDAILHRRASGLRLYKTHFEDKGLFSAAVNRFGNWHNALQAAGIQARVRERWSKDKVIERLREYAKTQPMANIRKIDFNLAFAASRRFGSIGKAMEAAGLRSKQTKPRKPRQAR